MALLQEPACKYQKRQTRLLEETTRRNTYLKKEGLIGEEGLKRIEWLGGFWKKEEVRLKWEEKVAILEQEVEKLEQEVEKLEQEVEKEEELE